MSIQSKPTVCESAIPASSAYVHGLHMRNIRSACTSAEKVIILCLLQAAWQKQAQQWELQEALQLQELKMSETVRISACCMHVEYHVPCEAALTVTAFSTALHVQLLHSHLACSMCLKSSSGLQHATAQHISFMSAQTGTASALRLGATAMDATASTVATTWRMKALASQLLKPFLNGTQMPLDPRFRLEQA